MPLLHNRPSTASDSSPVPLQLHMTCIFLAAKNVEFVPYRNLLKTMMSRIYASPVPTVCGRRAKSICGLLAFASAWQAHVPRALPRGSLLLALIWEMAHQHLGCGVGNSVPCRWLTCCASVAGQGIYWAVDLSCWALFCRSGSLSWSLNAWMPWNGDWDPFSATQSERCPQVNAITGVPANHFCPTQRDF